MLTLEVVLSENYNEETQEFVANDKIVLEMEHSLASISKWESIWEKAFLGKREKTSAETLSYIECMIMSPEVPENIIHRLTESNVKTIIDYINARQSATWIQEREQTTKSKDVVTSELMYFWMSSFNLDVSSEHWHLNRFLNLVKIASEKNSPKKQKMTRQSAQSRARLNQQRRAQLGSTG